MDLGRILSKSSLGRAIGKAAVCLALAVVALAAVRGAWSMARSTEPLVDFSHRVAKVVGPAASPTLGSDRLRFAVATMVSAEATFSTYRRLVQRICRDVGRREAFIVRPSYTDVREALEKGEVDVAFVCTGTYVHSLPNNRIKLLVQPEFEGGLEYRCLVIVPADSGAQEFGDLRGHVMAFTDPESNTGCLVPTAKLVKEGEDPKSFFSDIRFTRSHDKSILAVAMSMVDAAAIDALVWQSKLREDPSLAERVRILWRSEVFGPPPIVVPVAGEEALAESLQKALLALDKDDEGRSILSAIGIKRFVRPRPDSYKSVVQMYHQLARRGGFSWP